MGDGHQKDQAMIKSLEFSALSRPTLLQRVEKGGNGVIILFDHAYVRKPP